MALSTAIVPSGNYNRIAVEGIGPRTVGNNIRFLSTPDGVVDVAQLDVTNLKLLVDKLSELTTSAGITLDVSLKFDASAAYAIGDATNRALAVYSRDLLDVATLNGKSGSGLTIKTGDGTTAIGLAATNGAITSGLPTSTWSPTWAAKTGMTLANTTTNRAQYLRLGTHLVWFSCWVTTDFGGTAQEYVEASLPVVTNVDRQALSGLFRNGSEYTGIVVNVDSINDVFRVYRRDYSTFPLGTERQISVSGIYMVSTP